MAARKWVDQGGAMTDLTRRGFLVTVAAIAAAPPIPKLVPRMMTVEVLENDAWVRRINGLVEVKNGERFRMRWPTSGEIRLEATADSDGVIGVDQEGCVCGEIYYELSTAIEGTEKETL
jgi:hypothetical protein